MARGCVLDASLLIALGKAGQLELLRKTPAFEWYLGSLARGELLTPETKQPVEQMILDGVIQPLELDSDSEDAVTLFAEWTERVDAAEAESIALALSSGWLVALEDLAAQRKLNRKVGPRRWVNCASVLIAAVKAGSLTLAEADAVFAGLDAFGGYAKRGVTSLSQIDPSLKALPGQPGDT